jgi:DNA-binding transcriptional LysR family regulator
MLPTYVARPYLAAGSLVQVLPSARLQLGGVAIVYPSAGPRPPKVTAFRDFLIEALKREPLE